MSDPIAQASTFTPAGAWLGLAAYLILAIMIALV